MHQPSLYLDTCIPADVSPSSVVLCSCYTSCTYVYKEKDWLRLPVFNKQVSRLFLY